MTRDDKGKPSYTIREMLAIGSAMFAIALSVAGLVGKASSYFVLEYRMQCLEETVKVGKAARLANEADMQRQEVLVTKAFARLDNIDANIADMKADIRTLKTDVKKL